MTDQRCPGCDDLHLTAHSVIDCCADALDAAVAERDALRDALANVQKVLSVASVLPSIDPARHIVAAALAGTQEDRTP